MRSGIYAIGCRTTGKFYVGSAVSIVRRWTNHKSLLRKGKHHSLKLQRAWNKYGEDDFEFLVIGRCSADVLTEREQIWMDRLDASHQSKGYNVRPDARTMLGFKHSEESKTKMGLSGTLNPFYGKTHSPEILARLTEANRARSKDPAFRKASSDRFWSNPHPRLGKKHSEETKALIGRLAAARKHSPESIAKRAAKVTGRKHTLEARAKMRIGCLLREQKKRERKAATA